MEFGILGPLEVVDEGKRVAVAGVKERAVLALLLLQSGRVVSAERLIDQLWGEEPPLTARKSLQVRVAGLRKSLGADRILTRPAGYLIRVEPDCLDLARFERLIAASESIEPAAASQLLEQALDLWRGPALSDFEGENWASGPIARLEELRLVAVEKRIDAGLALGRHNEITAELTALVDENPLRERLRGQMMIALYRAGRQAEALEVYQRTRAMLVDELGIEPSPALGELERAILRQDPSLELTAPGEQRRSILVTVLDDRNVDALLAVAAPLAGPPPRRELIVVRPTVARAELATASRDLQQRLDVLRAQGIVARGAAYSSRAPGRDVVRTATAQDVDLLVIDGPPGLLADPELDAVLTESPCDVAVLIGGAIRVGSVLVPFTGAEHDWSAVEIGAWLARATETQLRLAGPETPAGDPSRLLADASLAVQRALGVVAEPLLVDAAPQALVAASRAAAVVVVGLSERWPAEGLGPARSAVVREGAAPTLLVRRGLRPGGLAPPESHTRFTWTVRPIG